MLPVAGGDKYHILTYGCQMNVRDSETIAGFLDSLGYRESQLEEADLIVFNTCSVRHSAENKVYGKLGEIARLKKKRPGLVVAFGGCMAQLPEVRDRLRRLQVDLVFGTHNLHELPRLLKENRSSGIPVTDVWETNGPVVEIAPEVPHRRGGISAYVNIMYGCDNFCSYCIVPYTRGRERSRHPREIVGEVSSLARRGYKEIILLGQNVNSYGRGLEPAIDFAGLLEQVHGIEGIKRIRFTTSHPKDVSDRLIYALASLPKCCHHLHVAMQAGSNRILERMNRGYTREHYLDVVERLRTAIPDIALSTDIIVGFPGETETEFEDTLDMVRRIQFDAAFTFMYSTRSGTRAAAMTGHLDYEIKNRRLLRLNELQYGIALTKNEALLNRRVEVLVEGPSKNDSSRLTSRTGCNRIVIFNGDESLIGQLADVTVEKTGTFSMSGRLIDRHAGINQGVENI